MEVFGTILRSLGRLLLQPLFLIVLLISVSGVGIYLFTEYRSVRNELSSLKGNPNTIEKEELDALVEKVGRLTTLPDGETPTVATVTDIDSIREQPFFNYAENGDKVLIYTEARRAVLYRPDTDKVIEVAPINIGQQEGLAQEEGEETEEIIEEAELRLAFSNGTKTAGLTVLASDRVTSDLNINFEVVSRTDAIEEYSAVTVVVLKEGFEGEAQRIADTLGGSIGELPENEPTPDADILVIVGSDYSTE